MLVFVRYTFPLKRFLRQIIAFYSFIIYRIVIPNYGNVVFHFASGSGTKWGGGMNDLEDC